MKIPHSPARRGIRPAVGLAVAAILAAPGAARADQVTDWNAIAVRSVLAALPAERGGALQVALAQAAVYDAVNAIDGSYKQLLVRPSMPGAGASKEAAAVAAAYQVLVAVFPSQKAALDADYASSLAAIATGPAKEAGVAIGADVAQKLLALRKNDGRMDDVPYVYSSAPGAYQPPSPASPPVPITPWMARVAPLVLKKPDQFRPAGPPELSSAAFAGDLDEVRRVGGTTSAERTGEQADLARFHTMNPNAFWGSNLNAFVKGQALSLPENARLLGQLWVSVGDATIACWDAKYHYNFWRPVTAIRASVDPAWSPLVPTPPHPEYPSAHSCLTGAVTETLRKYFGTRRIQMTFTSTAVMVDGNPMQLHYRLTDDFIDDVVAARMFGGMHFRSANEDGVVLGQEVARWVARREFLPRGH